MRARILLAAFFAFFIGCTVASAWTGPTLPPGCTNSGASAPNCNIPAPLNVGSTAQVKNGNIGVNGLAVFGNTLLGGSTGSNAYLNFGATAGSGGYGIRDNNGTMQYANSGGSWTNFGSGTSQWTTNGSSIYYSAGNVGINIGSPQALLDVNTGGTPGFADTVLVQGYKASLQLMNQASNQNWYFGLNDADSNKLYIGRGYGPGQGITPNIAVNPNGDVGIDTANPAQTLEVNGTSNFDAEVNLPSEWTNSGALHLNSNQVWNDTGALYLQYSAPANQGVVIGGQSGVPQSLTIANGNVTSPQYCIGSSCITAWTQAGNGGSGTINSGLTNQVAYYVGNGTTIGGASALSANNTSATANGNFFITGALYGSGSQSGYGALTVRGTKSGWSGIDFQDGNGNNEGTFMINPTYSGVYNSADNAWNWYWTGGTLTVGTVPAANVGAGTFPGNFAFSGSVTSPQYCIGSQCITSWPSGLSGSGASPYVPVFTGATTVGNSSLTSNAQSSTENGNFYSTGNVNVGSNNALIWSAWGGGFYMSDGTWIRGYGATNGLWMNSGPIGTNGSLTVGYGGSAGPTGGAIFAGNVGIQTSSPQAPLEIGNNVGTAGTANQIQLYNGGTGNIYGFGISSGQLNIISGNETAFYNGGTNVFDIYNNGAVSVANSIASPQYCIGTQCITSWPSSNFSGSGTVGYVTRFTTNGTTLGNSTIQDNGTSATASGNFFVSGNLYGSNDIVSSSAAADGANFRMIGGNYGAFFRNDGSNTYLLLTASGNQNGTWNTLRPFYVNDASGLVNMANGLSVTGGLAGDTITATSKYCIGSSSNCITSWPSAQWTTSGSSIYYSGGNVGIQTSSPQAPLEIGNNVGTAGTANQIQLYNGGAGIYGFGISSGQLNIISGNETAFYNGGTNVFDIYNNGAVSVANSIASPQYCIGTSCITSWPAGLSGTAPYVPVFTSATTLGNSSLTSNAQSSTENGNLYATGNIIATGGEVASQGSAAGIYAYDRTTSNLSAFYRTGDVTALWDSVIGNVLTYMNVGGTGYVGIDTSSPQAPLDVQGQLSFSGNSGQSGTVNRIATGGNTSWMSINSPSQLWLNNVSAANVFLATGGGNVGINTSSPSGKLDVESEGSGQWAELLNYNGGSTTGAYGLWTYGSTYAIDATGNVVVNSGNVVVNGNVNADAFLYNSDERLKTDIEPLTGNLAKVLQLQPVSYVFKNPQQYGEGPQIGFIAQQVQKVVPDIVHTDASTTLESIDYSKLTPILVGSVQDLNAKIEAQQTQIDSQQQEIDTLEQEVRALQNK